ncbi:hypothetical protein NMY22_g441 [Coprinellus aureogranulatus]|nr:hypothetical protein NMY22_g441 [Coprinellus aureogranulatus]
MERRGRGEMIIEVNEPVLLSWRSSFSAESGSSGLEWRPGIARSSVLTSFVRLHGHLFAQMPFYDRDTAASLRF